MRQILAWADAVYERTGQWPRSGSGAIEAAPGEKWSAVDSCLQHGHRGLAGGSSLTRLLAQQRGVRNSHDLPTLSIEQILTWADAFYERHGHWPRVLSGAIDEAPGENWRSVQTALQKGGRGLPGGITLARLLVIERGARNRLNPPR